ncbi:DUF4435 domain-containing protein [Streptomyces acidiscabies]|uniref:DUF4435 domain-containing protein n=1 Tax=Streptomyces acidiscabies TaxID=42234 RepID=UPI001FF68683|nr:hypothetical protein [Streptomyces sp. LBUM 1476]
MTSSYGTALRVGDLKSMRELDCVADRIRLNRQNDKRPVVILEGPSDRRILERAFRDQAVSYFVTGTRNVALEAAAQLADWKQEYFTCIVDRDFDDVVKGEMSKNASIHPYENADLEAMLLVSKTGIDLISELGSSGKIEKHGGEAVVVSKLLEIVAPVTRLRRASFENDWRLAFDEVDLAAKIEKKDMKFKLQSYCLSLHRESPKSPGPATLENYAVGAIQPRQEPSCPRGSSPYFRGRDFLAVLRGCLTW